MGVCEVFGDMPRWDSEVADELFHDLPHWQGKRIQMHYLVSMLSGMMN
jgi:hypothetical protein